MYIVSYDVLCSETNNFFILQGEFWVKIFEGKNMFFVKKTFLELIFSKNRLVKLELFFIFLENWDNRKLDVIQFYLILADPATRSCGEILNFRYIRPFVT